MKIAFIHFDLTTEAGDPRMVYSLAQTLRKRGHMTFIFAAEFDAKAFPELQEGITIHVVPPERPLRSLRGAEKITARIGARMAEERVYKDLARRIAELIPVDCDLVDFQNDYSFMAGIYYRRRNPKARLVWTIHNPPFYHAKKLNALLDVFSAIRARRERIRVKRYVKAIDVLITLDEERRRMVTPLGLPVHTLRIPVDSATFGAPAHSYLAGDPIILLGAGSLSEFRRYEDMIEAAFILRKKKIDARVVLVCKDFWQAREYRRKLLLLTRETGMEGWVDFRFDGVHDDELRVLQKKATVFVFPNTVNIWGMAALEAMAAGLPLLVSKSASVVEVLSDGKTAIFTEPGDPADIARKIEELVKDPARYAAIAVAGQEFVRDNLTWEKYADHFLGAVS